MLFEIGLFIKRKNKTKQKNKNKTKARKTKNITIGLSLGYPSSYFYNKRYNMLL